MSHMKANGVCFMFQFISAGALRVVHVSLPVAIKELLLGSNLAKVSRMPLKGTYVVSLCLS